MKYSCDIILKLGQCPRRRRRFKVFLLSALAAILFSGAEPFTILVEGHPRNIPINFFQNQFTGLRGDVF